MKRYNTNVLEAPEGYTFDVSEGKNGVMRVRLIPLTIATECSENDAKPISTSDTDYYGDYTNPPIPEGWKHIEGEWNNGFVIQDSKGNQFVWVPVGFLDSDGTIDGTNFSEKFGRRSYWFQIFSDSEFNEKMDEELRMQWESVKKYGGFYISRYNISKSKTGKAQSVQGQMPWITNHWVDAKKIAKTFGNGVTVTSHLPFGAEYDSTLMWFLKSGARTEEEIWEYSTEWGNYWDTKDSPQELVETGTRDEWATNHIYDFAGNVTEWTQEHH